MEAARVPTSPAAFQAFVARAFDHLSGFSGWVARWRPYICPLDAILARVPRGSSVLDIGCGSGTLAAAVAEFTEPRRVLGIDVNPGAIAAAQRCRPAREGRVAFEVRPPFSFPTGTFDVVLCVDVLHHVPRDRQWEFLDRVAACVRPGGRLLFKDISPRPWWKAEANRLHDLVMARQWVRYRHEDEVHARLAGRHGTVAAPERWDRLWYSHYSIEWQAAATTTAESDAAGKKPLATVASGLARAGAAGGTHGQ